MGQQQTLLTPAFNPIQALRSAAISETAQREAAVAQEKAERAACIALIEPLIKAWDLVFSTTNLAVIDGGNYPKSYPLAWGDCYGRQSDDPVERYCFYERVTAHDSHHIVFHVAAIIPSRGSKPVIRINGKGEPFKDFKDWYSAYQFCVAKMMRLLDQESLQQLKKA